VCSDALRSSSLVAVVFPNIFIQISKQTTTIMYVSALRRVVSSSTRSLVSSSSALSCHTFQLTASAPGRSLIASSSPAARSLQLSHVPHAAFSSSSLSSSEPLSSPSHSPCQTHRSGTGRTPESLAHTHTPPLRFYHASAIDTGQPHGEDSPTNTQEHIGTQTSVRGLRTYTRTFPSAVSAPPDSSTPPQAENAVGTSLTTGNDQWEKAKAVCSLGWSH
jgi:hypothetical protein